MSAIKRIPRGIRVLIIIVVLAILVWSVVPPDFLIYSLVAAVAVMGTSIFLIYRNPVKNQNIKFGKYAYLAARESDIDSSSGCVEGSNKNTIQPQSSTSGMSKDVKVNAAELSFADEAQKGIDTAKLLETIENAETTMPIINEVTSLTTEEKNQLVNAVWYQCENPFCKYTHFLDVHHLVDEKEGGTNKLSNLIVLCPYCHDLAHKNDIPVPEMLVWIGKREERFKFKLDWPY